MSTDIVFSFDSTGSMYPCLSEVRRKLSQCIDELFKNVDDLRIGIIAHGDYCDAHTTYVTKQFQLSNNKADLIHFVNNVVQTGGGDSDECYERVLKEVAEFAWTADNKVYVLIGDANPHQVGYKYGTFYVSDNWVSLAKALPEKGVKVYPIQCLNRHESTKFYETVAGLSGTPKLDLHQFTNIVPLITAITYKQQSDELVQTYGEQLKESGQLDRNLAYAFNLLLNSKDLIGGIEYSAATTDLEAVPPARFQMLHVDHTTDIKSFVLGTGARFKLGRGFYELTKPETVQENKEVILRDKYGDMFSGAKAREMLGIPYGVRDRVRPKYDLGYTVFIQSTSANRKLVGGTKFLYETE